jgi:nucleoside-diphosphate-sugar epimerase
MKLLVIGGSGRVGSAVIRYLRSEGHDVIPLDRHDLTKHHVKGTGDLLSEHAHQDCSVIVNLAGKAHLVAEEESNPEVWMSNVGLPLTLAELSHTWSIPLLHLSSTKADIDPRRSTIYAASKRCAEVLLQCFAFETGTRIICLRTCAVLAPPFEAGKLSKLRKVAWIPSGLVPRVATPVVHPRDLALAVSEAAADLASSKQQFEIREVSARMNLREVLVGLRSSRPNNETPT